MDDPGEEGWHSSSCSLGVGAPGFNFSIGYCEDNSKDWEAPRQGSSKDFRESKQKPWPAAPVLKKSHNSIEK